MAGLKNETLTKWRLLFKLMDEGAIGSGIALRPDLQTEVNEHRTAFAELMHTFYNQQAQEKQERRQARTAKASALELLAKVQGDLTSHTDEEDETYVLELYHLDNIDTSDRHKILALCQHVAAVSAAQTEIHYQVTQPLLQELQTKAETLAAHLDRILRLHSELAATRTALRNALVAGRFLKKRVYGYMISVLPRGKRDPKLMDFGFRLRGRRRKSSSVTVVAENENSAPVAGVKETSAPV